MSAANVCPSCKQSIAHTAQRCPACGAAIPGRPRLAGASGAGAVQSWTGLDSLVISQEAAMLYWYFARDDHAQLSQAVAAWSGVDSPVRRLLAAKLHRGIVCDADQLPREVVTMNSRVELRLRDDQMSGVLAYSADASDADSIAITSPLGALLLGLLAGRSLRSQMADGTAFTLAVENVQQPPAAAGASRQKLAS